MVSTALLISGPAYQAAAVFPPAAAANFPIHPQDWPTWRRSQTLLFIVGASLGLWAAIISAAVAIT